MFRARKKIELGLKFKPKRFMDSEKGPFSFSYFFPPPRVELFLHLTLKRRQQPRCQIKHIKGETTTKGMKVFSLNYLGGCLNNNKKAEAKKNSLSSQLVPSSPSNRFWNQFWNRFGVLKLVL